MITLYYNGKEEEISYAPRAVQRIHELEAEGYLVTWSCWDPEDNEYLWENV